MVEIEIVKKSQLQVGASTPGIIREVAFTSKNVMFVLSTVTKANESSGWHSHGGHDVYGYVVSGRQKFEYGPDRKSFAEAGPGDFFHIPAGTVHRDTAAGEEQVKLVLSFVGTGPIAVNVKAPET